MHLIFNKNHKRIAWYFFIITVSISCTNKTDQNVNFSFEEFMYPEKAEPYVYVYQDSLNPIYEMFERVITKNVGGSKQMLVERYNYNFQLVEAYLLSYENQFQVLNHVLYMGSHEIPTMIADSVFMPYNTRGVFETSFPSTTDSIMFSMRNVRHKLADQCIFIWEGQNLPTMRFVDSIFTLAIDMKNEKEQAQNGVAIHHFAKGVGRVMIAMEDNSSILVLKKVLSEDQWKNIITK